MRHNFQSMTLRVFVLTKQQTFVACNKGSQRLTNERGSLQYIGGGKYVGSPLASHGC